MASKNVVNTRDWRALKQTLANEIDTLSVTIAENKQGEDESNAAKERHAADLAEYRRIYAEMDKIEQTAKGKAKAAREFLDGYGRELVSKNEALFGPAIFSMMSRAFRLERVEFPKIYSENERAGIVRQNLATRDIDYALEITRQRIEFHKHFGETDRAGRLQTMLDELEAAQAAGEEATAKALEKHADRLSDLQDTAIGHVLHECDRDAHNRENAALEAEHARQLETQKKQIAEQSGAILAAAMKHAQTGATPAPAPAKAKRKKKRKAPVKKNKNKTPLCSLAELVQAVRHTIPEKLSAVTDDDLKTTIDNRHNTKKYKALVSQDTKPGGAGRLFYARPLLDYACQVWERKQGQKSWSICIDENEKSMILNKLTGEK